MDYVTILVQAGAGGLVVIVVIYFLREMRSVREGFLNTINNHLHENTTTLQQLKEAIKEMIGFMRRNGGGS
jgi:predicted PurR-regulated permease PerM